MYSVANFLFRVILPEGRDADMLLPSFRPFRVSEEGGPVLFTLTVVNGERLTVSGERLAVSGERTFFCHSERNLCSEESRLNGERMNNERLAVNDERTFFCHSERNLCSEESRLKGEQLADERMNGERLAVSGERMNGEQLADEHMNDEQLTFNENVPKDPFTLHPSPFALHPSPLALHPSPFTLHPSPLLLEDENDMGHLRLYAHPEGYLLHLHYDARWVHTMLVDRSFRNARAWVHWEDPYVESVLCSLLRIVFSQAILPHGGISLHASVVTNGGLGYLFMGVSGTGKSTHSRLWLEHVPGSELLNDDNPIIRLMEDGTVRVFGSPWSGKTPCYRAHDVPVGGMVQLQQAPANRFHPQDPVSAFTLVLPGCSVVRADERLFDALCDTLSALCTATEVALLECLPDRDAALCCYESFKRC